VCWNHKPSQSDDAVNSVTTNATAPVRSSESGSKRPATDESESGPGTAGLGRLRVGVMLDGWTDRAWVGKVIEDIQRSDVAQIAVVVINRAESRSGWRRIHKRLPNLLYALYHRLDRWIFRRWFKIRLDALDPVELRPLLGEAAVLEVLPRRQRYTDHFDPASVEWIRNQRLDVILRFGFRIIRGPILESACYGVWSFHHGDNREYRGGPPMFWEMYEMNPICGVSLQILTDQLDGGKVIYRASEKTNLFSLYLNRNRNYWKATSGVLPRLRQLHARGWPALRELDSYQEQVPYTKPIYRDPRTLVMLKFLGRLFARFVRRVCVDLLMEEQWFIAWRRPQGSIIKPATEGESFRLLLPPRGYFYADPLPIKHQGRYFIFFEDFEYATKRGVISWVELDSQGNPSQPRAALSTDCHLSYPFVFEHDGQVYMIPETRQRRRIELWRADHFPDQWKFDRVLMDDVSSADTTWLHYQDKYWLFTGANIAGTTASDALYVFWSDSPFGPWQPHRANPVVTTIQGARPAGRLFVHNGQLIRPGQDGAKVYGHRVHLFRVELLDESEYRETRIETIGPEWLPGNIGTHTYHRDEDFEVIDGRTLIMRGLRLRRRRLDQA
jgi:hypothetical protein